MSGLQCSGFCSPIHAMMFLEFGCSDQSETTWFQGLSAGKTSRAEQMASASGVQKRMGLLIGGIWAEWMRASRAGLLPAVPFFAGAAGAMPLGVAVRSTVAVPILPLMR